MGMVHYCRLVVWTAFRHSASLAQAINFFVLVIIGAAISVVAGFGMAIDASELLALLSNPKFYAILFGSIVLLRLLCAPYWIWKEEREARLKAEDLVYHQFIDIEHSFLFLDPPDYESWKAKIIFTMAVPNVQIYLDFSAYPGGHAWDPKKRPDRLVLKRNVNFAKGAAVSIDLMELHDNDSMRFWRLAGDEKPMLLSCHRCQLVFVNEQGRPLDYFDFFVSFHYEEKPPPIRDGKMPTRYEKAPSLIGENLFLYARNWKSEDANQRATYDQHNG